MEKTNKKKVLIVDDDKNLRLVLVDKLNISGFEAVGASDGKEGLEKAFKLHPDVILLDVLMPEMNGLEVLENLRNDEWGSKAKVIMLTVLEDMEIVSRAMQSGGFGYLVKTDYSMDQIVEKVKEILK